MDLGLRGKRALVPGASKGIGQAVSEVLAEEGCDLVLTARDEVALDALAGRLRQDFGVRVDVVPADLSTVAGVGEVAGSISDLDVLVNNAGAIPPGRLAEVDAEQWRRAWDLKVFGFSDLTRALYDRLSAHGGVIVNVSGAAGEKYPPAYIAGAAGNAALMGFTRALGAQAPGDGLRVVAVSPGPVATDRNTTMLRAQAVERFGDGDRWQELTASMPYGRAATPREIADAVAFLASPRSGYTNGAILTINGGG